MPYLRIQTNQPLSATQQQNLLKSASNTVATALGKPERYVMIEINDNTPMMFAGTDEPLAYLELKSIDLPVDKTTSLSASLCAMLNSSTGIAKDRVYIEFSSADRPMWGWDSKTF